MTKPRNDLFNTFYLVWTKPRDDDDRTQKPVKRTYTDPDRALVVANQMATKNPGRKFFVLASLARVRTVGEELEVAYNPDYVDVELDETEERNAPGRIGS